MLLSAVLLMVGLGFAYFFQQQAVNENAETDALPPIGSTNIILIDRQEAEIVSVRFTAPNGHDMTLFAQETDGETVWAMLAAPDAPIYQSMAREMIRAFYHLSAEEQLFESIDNPQDYGIGENITATATYTDGTTATIFVGKMTSSHERFYMMLEGDPGLYLLYTYFGNRYLNTADDLIDRRLPDVILDGAEYLLIAERGAEPIEFTFIGTEEEKEELYLKYGIINITMVSPHPGRELYYSSMERTLMESFNTNFRLGELVELFPADYAPYGLDEPSLEFHWVGNFALDELHLLFGDRLTDEGLIYVKQADRPEVFLADFTAVSAMYGVNPYLFIERFIALIDIMDVDTIEINYPSQPGRSHSLHVNHGKTPPDENNPDGRDTMNPTINGTAVTESDFKLVYRYLIGLTSDVEIEPYEPETGPEFTVTFNKRDGKPPVQTAYYPYEANFFAMSRDGGPCVVVTSRQATDVFFKGVEDVLEGL
jgi:hypothetical protein